LDFAAPLEEPGVAHPCRTRDRMPVGRNALATNVRELYRFEQPHDPRSLAQFVTIRAPENILPAALCLARKAHSCGLRMMIWHDLATLAPTTDAQGHELNAAIFGWSTEELAHWRQPDKLLRSQVLRAARIESEPFWMNRDGIRTCWANAFLGQIALDDFEEITGLSAAIVIPVHLPFGQIGAAILSPIDGDTSDLEAHFANFADDLAGAVRRFVRGYVMVTRDARYLPGDCQLSPREVECLRWVAQGKTDYEISIILGCSHAGIRYHLTRASERLGAMNRAQAVFRAGQLGYLGLTERHA
jgi:DNA-binding CsgD family transcriptional regulator